ncbi:MAG: SurA N-terminal domain-containing protein [Verrucomicrobia bacterium]|nr:SurA N-terminal domain-containing protein [Verrucomicrobiota bacterium]
MLISKFNRMIRNKFIWGALAVIVSVSFVLSYSAVTSSCSRSSPDAIATLFGHDVSYLEFRKALLFEQGFDRQRQMSDEEQKELDASAWKRIAVLQMADKMGITTPMQEVGRVIRQSPGFAVDGVFDKNQYARLIANRVGIDTGTFELFQQENMTIEKLYTVMRSMVWTAPYEVNTKVRDLTDQFKVEYALFETHKFTPELDQTEQNLRDYYSENMELFREPKRVRVKYVSFPFDAYVSTNAIAEERVVAYYENHQEDFVPEGATNDFIEYSPIDDVRDEIVEKLQKEDMIEAARVDAMEFAVFLIPDRGAKAPTMEEAADTNGGRPVQLTAEFSEQEQVSDLVVGNEFNLAAFRLVPGDVMSMYSDAILGDTAAYVIALNNTVESFIPDFETARDKVIPLATAAARKEAFEGRIDAIAEQVHSSLSSNQPLSVLLNNFDVDIVTTDFFTVMDSMVTNKVQYSDVLGSKAVDLATGQVSSPIYVEEGAILARLLNRHAGPPEDTYNFAPQVQRTLIQYRSAQTFESWRDYVLQLAEFKDLRQNDSDESRL